MMLHVLNVKQTTSSLAIQTETHSKTIGFEYTFDLMDLFSLVH